MGGLFGDGPSPAATTTATTAALYETLWARRNGIWQINTRNAIDLIYEPGKNLGNIAAASEYSKQAL
jgi:hypothetical protein